MLSVATGGIRLKIKESDAERAMEIIKEIEPGNQDSQPLLLLSGKETYIVVVIYF